MSFLSHNFPGARVIKVGDHTPCDAYLGCDGLKYYRKRGSIVYVHRETPAVIDSQYHFMRIHDDQTMLDFAKQPNLASTGPYCDRHPSFCRRRQAGPGDPLMSLSRVKYHQYHVWSWMQQAGVLHLSYAELHDDKDAAAARIASHTGLPMPAKVFDATKDHSKAESFRTGSVDAYKVSAARASPCPDSAP